MRVCSVIQARLSSSRLPAKVLKHLPFNSDITVLQQVIRRVKRSKSVDDIVVATTNEPEDLKIVDIAEAELVRWFRGSKEDLLERYYFAAKESKADVVVRITSDCPCIDSYIIDRMVDKHIQDDADYTSNCHIRTFPHGIDVQVANISVVEEAYLKANKKYEREHVFPYIYETCKDRFKISHLLAEEDERGEDIRITIDTLEDYILVCTVFDYLYDRDNFFGCKDIVTLFKNKPWLKYINQKIVQKKNFEDLEEELKEAIKILELQELYRSSEILKRFKVKI